MTFPQIEASAITATPFFTLLQTLQTSAAQLMEHASSPTALLPPQAVYAQYVAGETRAPLSRRAVIDRLLAERRARLKAFPRFERFVTGPAWAILLDLAMHRERNTLVSVSSACIASGAAPTTALRHLETMGIAGLIVRSGDPDDKRRVYVALSPAAEAMMNRYVNLLSQTSGN